MTAFPRVSQGELAGLAVALGLVGIGSLLTLVSRRTQLLFAAAFGVIARYV